MFPPEVGEYEHYVYSHSIDCCSSPQIPLETVALVSRIHGVQLSSPSVYPPPYHQLHLDGTVEKIEGTMPHANLDPFPTWTGEEAPHIPVRKPRHSATPGLYWLRCSNCEDGDLNHNMKFHFGNFSLKTPPRATRPSAMTHAPACPTIVLPQAQGERRMGR